MAQHPSLSRFEENFHSFVTPKSESASCHIFIAHHGYDLTSNIRDADLRLDYLTPDISHVTKGTHGRPVHPSVQAPSSPEERITSKGVWDVNPELVATTIIGPTSLNQVKEELRNLITSRQSNPSTSTCQETKKGYRNPPHIQNVSHPFTWTNAGLLSITPFSTNFSEMRIKIQIQKFSFMKRHLNHVICEMAAILFKERWVKEPHMPNAPAKYQILPTHAETPTDATCKITNRYIQLRWHLWMLKKNPSLYEQECTLYLIMNSLLIMNTFIQHMMQHADRYSYSAAPKA